MFKSGYKLEQLQVNPKLPSLIVGTHQEQVYKAIQTDSNAQTISPEGSHCVKKSSSILFYFCQTNLCPETLPTIAQAEAKIWIINYDIIRNMVEVPPI